MSEALTHGSLFAGMGGLDLAIAEVFGAETAWVSDVDPGACAILAHRFPGVPNLGDITAVDWASVEPVDIISGGSPCQDVSQAGRRAGMTEGTRSNLWVAMRAAIAALRPRLVIWENVNGALSACASCASDSDLGPCPRCVDPDSGAKHSPNLRALGRVLGDLASLGYDAEWVSLRAADVGACHGRRRVFVVAYPRGEAVGLWAGLCAGVSSGLGWGRPDDGSVQARVLPTPTVRDVKGHNQRRDDTCLTGALLPTPRATRGGSTTETMALLPTPSASNPNDDEDLTTWQDRRARVKETAGNGNGFGTPLGVAVRLLPTPTTTDANGAGAPEGQDYRGVSLTDATVRQPHRWGDYAAAIARHEHLYGPAPDPTEPTGKGGAHRLSPRFAEWLMCLPAGWVTDPAIWHGWTPSKARNAQLKALGNGVVPPQALAALQHMAARHGALAA